MDWTKSNSENAKFAQDNDIDFESAVDYRSGKIPNLIHNFIKLQIINDEQMRSGYYGQEAHQKNLAFEQLPRYEDFMGSVYGNVYWYKALLKNEAIRNFYP